MDLPFLLFIRRAKDPGRGMLSIPGGFVDTGETAEEGLRRELREEVNLEVTTLEFLCTQPNVYHYQGMTYPVLDLFFLATALNPERARALDDVEALSWRNLSTELVPDELAFPSMRSALEVLRQRESRG
jgi:ADP-ribose pyrophosphatase YjhB (NUDIX family)